MSNVRYIGTVSFPHADKRSSAAVLFRGWHEVTIGVERSWFTARSRNSQPAPESADAGAEPGWLVNLPRGQGMPPAGPARRRGLQGAQDATLFNVFLPLPCVIAQQDFGLHQ